MMIRSLIPIFSASIFLLNTQAQATTTIAESTFNDGADGWTTGEFTNGAAGVLNPTYDPTGKLISTTDTASDVAFIAPNKFLGDLSSAFGGMIVFQLSDIANDNPALYSSLAITSGSSTFFSTRVLGPGTALTSYSVAFVGANFFTANPFGPGGTALTDAQLQSVLANVSKIAILADWNTGADNTRLDSVVLTSGVPAVPEPATWAMMVLGLGMVGGTMRAAKRRQTLTVSYA